MSKEQRITGNITPPNKDLETLKKHFPQCFDKSGNLDFEKLKKQLSKNEINFSKESYGMDWLGKSYARLLATDETTTLLKEDETFNQKKENATSENLLIKGDNLEVLKHLSNAYYEKIKMIYIDPPYNTGSDGFVYQDDRKFTAQELQELAGVSEERAKRILDFTQSNSNSHSAWLTFIYPRLYIAKQLLKEDGAIFVSIDDNEIAQLKLLLDEIFGEENFVGEIPTIMNLKGNQDSFGFAETHEYFLVYSKNKDKTILNKFNIDEEALLKKWKEDEYGLYKVADNLRATGENAPREKRQNLWHPIFLNEETKNFYVTNDNKPINKSDIIIFPINPEGEELSWYWGKSTFRKKKHNLILNRTKNGWQFYRKQRPDIGDIPTKKPKSFFYKSDYSTSTATTQLKKIFNKKVFKGPKPVPFIMDLVIIGMSQEDLILDFFAGSGTTGDAIMQLNTEDGGNRKYILVQLPELIDKKNNKTAYDFVKDELKVEEPTIFEITKERLIRASKKIQEENLALSGVEEKDKDLSNQDLGFKIFETMPIWEDYNFEVDELDAQQMLLFDESKLTKEDIKALLVTWKTYDGVPLTESLQEIDLTGYTANYSNGKLYLMDKGFKTKNLKALLEKIDSDKDFNPTTIIAFGYHFESKNLREISENIKSYTNKKSIDIDFITRY
ncbi:MAG: site-specific DNA-methyltransferase [Flavobacteriaceae bacterium]|nr:site-specific DNA-methyltransferase [Flavobacteriaceae bacterium]